MLKIRRALEARPSTGASKRHVDFFIFFLRPEEKDVHACKTDFTTDITQFGLL